MRLVLVLVLRLLITLGFMAALLSKLGQHARWTRQFVAWGYPAWGADVTSILETVGVAALWVPRVAQYASAMLGVILLGDVGT